MKNPKFKTPNSIIFIFLLIVIIFLPLRIVSAETTQTILPSPVGEDVGIEDVIGNIIKVVLGLVGVLALIFFIYGGIMWMTSAGNMEKVKKGKNAMVWALLGLAVCFLAYSIVTFVITQTSSLGE